MMVSGNIFVTARVVSQVIDAKAQLIGVAWVYVRMVLHVRREALHFHVNHVHQDGVVNFAILKPSHVLLLPSRVVMVHVVICLVDTCACVKAALQATSARPIWMSVPLTPAYTEEIVKI